MAASGAAAAGVGLEAPTARTTSGLDAGRACNSQGGEGEPGLAFCITTQGSWEIWRAMKVAVKEMVQQEQEQEQEEVAAAVG